MAESIAEVIDNIDFDAVGGEGTDQTEEGTDNAAAEGSAGEGAGNDEGTTGGSDDSGNGEGAAKEGSGESGEGTDGDSGDDSGESGDDEGYVADELELPEADKKDEADKGKTEDRTDAAKSSLSPELQFIVENLPDMTVRGKSGGETKVFTIKSPNQLPDDFEFVSDKDRSLFQAEVAAQETRANQLQSQYRTEEAQRQVNQYREQENAAIRTDIGDLQREGLLPKFKHQPTDPGFADDPAVKQAQEVIDFMNQKNDAYAKANKLYRIDFRTAFELMQAQKGSTAPAKKDPVAEEDAARKTATRRTAGASSAPSSGMSKPKVYGSTGEMFAAIDNLEL